MLRFDIDQVVISILCIAVLIVLYHLHVDADQAQATSRVGKSIAVDAVLLK